MTTTSRSISMRTRPSRNSHTPGKDKGAYCVRQPAASMACSINPYKGQGIPAKYADGYKQWWDKMKGVNR